MNAQLLAHLASIFCRGRRGHPPRLTADVRRWFGGLVHGDLAVREEVRRYLVRLGKNAVPCLVELLDEPDDDLAGWAAEVLADMGPLALGALTAALSSPRDAMRKRAAWVLRTLRTG